MHCHDEAFITKVFQLFLPMSLEQILKGHLKKREWRKYQMTRLIPKPRLDIVRHLLTSNDPPRGSMMETLDLNFMVKIKDLGYAYVEATILLPKHNETSEKRFFTVMRISPVKLRNIEFKLILSFIDIKRFLVKGFNEDINRRNIVDYLREVLSLTKVVNRINYNILTIPFSRVLRLSKFSESSFFTNTIEKDISFTRRGEAFLDEAIVNYNIESKVVMKINGKFAILVICKLVGAEVYKFHVYFPQLKKSFQFRLFEEDLFSAEIGLHHQAIQQGSKFNQSIGFGFSSARSLDFLEKSFPKAEGNSVLNSDKKPKRRYPIKGLKKNESFSQIMKVASNIQFFDDGHQRSRIGLTNKLSAIQISRPILSNWILDDLDDITSKNVLEDYFKYEKKCFEIIRHDVLSRKEVNLKHTRECLETFADPKTLLMDSRSKNYKKFHTAFYWRCMLQMLSVTEAQKSLRVNLSKFEDSMQEFIDRKMVTIRGQLFMVSFALYHGDGFELADIAINQKSKVEVKLANLSQNYERTDLITFGHLIKIIRNKKFYPYSAPNVGNLKIACSIGCRNILLNLSLMDIRKPQNLLFLDKNLRFLLSPIIEEINPDKKSSLVLGAIREGPISPRRTSTIIKLHYEKSSMNLTSRTFESMHLSKSDDFVVLLARKVFLLDPSIVLWILLEKRTYKIIFLFYFSKTSQIKKRATAVDFLSKTLYYLEVLLDTCRFSEAGERIFAAFKNEMIRLFYSGSLFD